MTGKQFVDSNILIYAHDADAGERWRRAPKVLEELRSPEPGSSVRRFCKSST